MRPELMRAMRQTTAYKLYRFVKDRRDFGHAQGAFAAWTPDDRRRAEFYAQFIGQDDLVFDVGANIGNRTKVFLALGARVIAYEPQRKCADFLERVLRGNQKARVERKALGRAVGQSEMLVSASHTISSLSTEWVNAVQESGRFSDQVWNGREEVQVGTLDDAIREHGSPAFIKIDVEGFELEVLSGLSQRVRAVSFEFTPELTSRAEQCVDRLASLGPMEGQISLGESMTFALPAWVSADELCSRLRTIERTEFGDVYVRYIQN